MPFSNIIPLNTKQIKSGLFPVLGSGLWGSVLDIGDNSVLKLARRKCAGIGDGRTKIQREASVLKAIEATRDRCTLNRCTLEIATLLGWGEHKVKGPSSEDSYELWLHTAKVSGVVRTVTELEEVSDTAAQEIASSIACAIANIHSLLHQATPNLQVPTVTDNLKMIEKEVSGLTNSQHYISQITEVLHAFQSEEDPVIHGDCNISNLLFKGNTVCAAVDFAEVRGGFYEEDLAAIIAELPAYKTSLIQAFETYSGSSVSHERLNYGLALNAFISYVISSRAGNETGSAIAQSSLENLLRTF